jgi:hypothetical protein
MGAALLAVALAVFGAAHVALVVGLARARTPHAWGRALAALFVAPLAPWWGYRSGMRWQSYVWAGALAVYAAGVALS